MEEGVVSRETAADRARLLIRPNRSLPPRGMLAVCVSFAAVALAIGLGFGMAGAWLVLPFAGLESAIVVAVFYLLYRHHGDYESVAIDAERVQIVQHCGGRQRRHVFVRYWARVVLAPDPRNGRALRLAIGSHGRFIELGAQLDGRAREHLASELRTALAHGR